MSNPARSAREAAAANGFTEVKTKHKNGITLRNPSTGKCCFETQVGQIYHYGPTLEEADSAWVAGVAPWNYQMVKADFNLFALSNFSNGQILKWLDPASGQYVTFQPMALQWTNSLNQIQQISMPQSVAAQISDEVLYWPAAYGTGRNFKYVASTSRLSKLLIIDSAANLPSTSYDTLELNFIMSMSAGVTPYIDSGSGLAAWDKKTQKNTVKAIEFRLSNGTVVWSFAAPTAYDSLNNPETGFTTGSMRLKKQGSSFYVSVRFPKAWIDAAQFPIFLDPTVDYQVGASADDGYSTVDNDFPNYGIASTSFILGRSASRYNSFARWADVTIPDGATITSDTYISLYFNAYEGTPPECDFYFEDAAAPGAVTSRNDFNSRTKTTAHITQAGPTSGTWWNTSSIQEIVQELVDSYSYADGEYMQLLVLFIDGDMFDCSTQRSWNYSGNTYGPKLHIEYTEAGGSTVIPVFMNQYRQRR